MTLRHKRYTYNENRTASDIAACVTLLDEWDFENYYDQEDWRFNQRR